MLSKPDLLACGDYRTKVAALPSPGARRTCMVEIFEQTGFNSAATMLDIIEA